MCMQDCCTFCILLCTVYACVQSINACYQLTVLDVAANNLRILPTQVIDVTPCRVYRLSMASTLFFIGDASKSYVSHPRSPVRYDLFSFR